MAIYTCVLLDVDNTILDFDAAERQALTDMLAEYELPHDEAAYDTYHKVNRELWDSLAKGQLNKQKLFQIRFSRFMQTMQLPDNGKGKAMNDRYEELLATHADLLPGALTALEELSEVATLALVSNGAIAVQESRIAASGIDRYMDGIYISEKVGAAKPSAKLFEHAFRDLGITNKSRVLMVGDDLLADIKGGLNAGVDTCWFNPGNLENKSGITPKYTVSSYEELYIARCSLGRASDYYNEELLYRLFGVNAELLIDHAWGWEPCTIADIKAYKPAEHSVGSGQVLTSVTLFGTARLIAKEMAETLALDLVSKGLKTNRVALAVGYDTASLDPGRLDAGAPIELKRAAEAAAASYTGPVGTDYYGRRVPKAVSGSVDLGGFTSSASTIRTAIDRLFCRLVDSRLLVRRLNVTALDVAAPTELAAGKRYEQPDLFSAASGGDDAQTGSGERGSHGVADERSEQAVQQALLDIKRKFGKNSVIKAMDMFDGATGQQRNNQIGGHAA